jgi:hypothetical protein
LDKQEQLELDIIEIRKTYLEIHKSNTIPFQKEMFGVSPINKEYLEELLIYTDAICQFKSNKMDVDEFNYISNSLVHKLYPLLEKIEISFNKSIDMQKQYIKYYDSYSLMNDCINDSIDELDVRKSNFVFYKHILKTLTEERVILKSISSQLNDDYENSKNQCNRIIKKINHNCISLSKNWTEKIDVVERLTEIFDDVCSPFLEWNHTYKQSKCSQQYSFKSSLSFNLPSKTSICFDE